MPATDYQPPVSQLLNYGIPKNISRDEWFDYVEAYGFTEEHIPALIRLATEENLNWQNENECYAPIHACRALGQLNAETAIPSLIHLLDVDDDDWLMEDLPKVFGMIGAVCIPSLTGYLADKKPSVWSKVAAAAGLAQIAKHPGNRDECVQHLIEALSRHRDQLPELNGSLVAKLLDLHATEAASVIEKAYKIGPMDEMICGSWARVQIELGLATAADFSPEELQHKTPEWMERIQEMVDLAVELAPSDDVPSGLASIKKTSEELKLSQYSKESLVFKNPSSSQTKAGFGKRLPKKRKKKKKKKR